MEPINPPPPAHHGPSAATPPPASSKDERMWAMFCHLSVLSGYVIPFGNIVGPLIVWMIKRDEYPLVADQGKEALNFQITVWIAVICCIPLCFVCIGVPLLIGIGLADLILTIVAMVKANEGVRYRYPLTIRMIT